MDPKKICERAEAALQERNRFEPMFDDAIRLTMPGRTRFKETDVTRLGDDIFDETGANGVAEFVSRVQSGIMPPFTEFMTLEADGNIAPRDREKVNRDLAGIAEYAFERIWESNFAQEVSESLFDMAISTGVLNVENGGRHGALVHRAIPITELSLERGPDDGVGGLFRHLNDVPVDHLPSMYPHAQGLTGGGAVAQMLKSEQDRKVDIIEYTRRSFDTPNRTEHFVVCKQHNEIIAQRTLDGRGSNPFLAYRWQTTAGQVWGRGPLLNAMGAVRTTNLMIELILENAAMAIVGMYQTDNDATINADTVRLVPGTILTKEIGTMGLEPIRQASGNFSLQDVVIADQRLNIKRALFNDMLSDPNKTPATATEVVERMADLANRTAAGFSRLFYELLAPYMVRVLFILEERGDITLPTLKGKGIKFRAVSPVAHAQYARELQKLVQGHAIRTQIYGPQAAAAAYNYKELHQWLNKREGLDEQIYATADEVIKAMEAQAQMAANMQMAAMQSNQGGQR